MRNTVRLLFVVTVGLVCARSALAQNDNTSKNAGLSVHEIVKNANRMLSEGQAQAALEAYQEAEKLLPDSPEIAFGRGLAYYRLKQMEEAREAFRKAQTASDPSLAQDAKYSLATCDHAEALQSSDDPKGAITKLESAMQQYHDVLSANPKHEAAKDANLKAAASWRQLKQLLQQQQQQGGDKNNEDQQENQDQRQNSSKDQQQQDKQKKDQQQQQEGEKQEQSQNDQQQSSQEQKDQQSAEQQEGKENQEQKQSSAKDEQKEQKQTEAQEMQKAEEKEKSAHDQAQRRLREMIQSMQQRKRARAQPVQPLPSQPPGKDW